MVASTKSPVKQLPPSNSKPCRAFPVRWALVVVPSGCSTLWGTPKSAARSKHASSLDPAREGSRLG